jgi:hypothetical protein
MSDHQFALICFQFLSLSLPLSLSLLSLLVVPHILDVRVVDVHVIVDKNAVLIAGHFTRPREFLQRANGGLSEEEREGERERGKEREDEREKGRERRRKRM